MADRYFYVYIMSNSARSALFSGVTTDMERRAREHRRGTGSVFTRKFRTDRLVYFEGFARETDANRRVREIRRGTRAERVKMVARVNPRWLDLGR